MMLWEANCPEDRKRIMRPTEHMDVNRLILEFFNQCRAKNIPLSGPIIRNKAKYIADAIGDRDFCASNGWLRTFIERNNITLRDLSGESQDIDSNTVKS